MSRCLLWRAAVGMALFTAQPALEAADCNENGVNDAAEIRDGVAPDCNRNQVPDECDLRAWPLTLETTDQVPLGRGAAVAEAFDLDADGELDLVSTNPSVLLDPANSASVIWNLGNRKFSVPFILPLASVTAAAAADLDQDGDGDIIVAEGQRGILTLFLNQGGETFAPVHEIPAGFAPYFIRAADLNGDRTPDFVASSRDGINQTVFLSRGPLEYAPQPLFSGRGLPEVRDLDGDGSLDVATYAVFNSWPPSDPPLPPALAVYWNDGKGKFTEPTSIGNIRGASALSLLDLDSDGLLDIAAGGKGIWVFQNEGNRKFNLIQELQPAEYVFPVGLDLDGDGDVDLVVAETFGRNGVSGIQWAENIGEAILGPLVYLLQTPHPIYLSTADLDGNGLLDLLWCDYSQALVSFRTALGPTLNLPVEVPTGVRMECLVQGDWNGNGVADLAVGGSALMTFLNGGGGVFQAGQTFDLASSDVLVPGDFDGDDDLDLATQSGSRALTFAVLRNGGEGRFTVQMDTRITGRFSSPSASDLDRDGDLDLLLQTARNTATPLLNNGNGTFRTGEPLPLAVTTLTVSLGDVNSDGLDDLIVPRVSAGTVSVLLNIGDVLFDEGETIRVDKDPKGGTALADLDGDRKLDLSVGCSAGQLTASGPSTVVALRGRGDGTFEAGTSHPVGKGPRSVLAADLNGDGAQDLVAACVMDACVSVLSNRGDGTLLPEKRLPYGSGGILLLATPDVDGDGLVDLAVADSSSGLVTVWRNASPPVASRDSDLDGIPDECGQPRFRRGDADGDGALDLTDPIFVLAHLFSGGPEPGCVEAADADNDGSQSVADAIVLIQFLFLAGAPPARPGPPPADCGEDPDAPGSPGDFGCLSYQGC